VSSCLLGLMRPFQGRDWPLHHTQGETLGWQMPPTWGYFRTGSNIAWMALRNAMECG